MLVSSKNTGKLLRLVQFQRPNSCAWGLGLELGIKCPGLQNSRWRMATLCEKACRISCCSTLGCMVQVQLCHSCLLALSFKSICRRGCWWKPPCTMAPNRIARCRFVGLEIPRKESELFLKELVGPHDNHSPQLNHDCLSLSRPQTRLQS